MAYEDPDDKLTIPVTKLQWGLKGAQIFFAFLAMACIASVIAFDNRTTSSTIIDNIFIFFVILSMFMSAAIVGIPYSYIEYGKFENLARALRIVRIEFVLTAIWAILIFLVSVAVSVEMGVKNCDPFAPEYAFALNRTTNETFIDGLSGRCRTARAANAFGWFALVVWLGSLALVGKEWYESRRQPLPKHDFHRDEITMNSSSSKSSLDASGSGGFRPPQGSQSPHQENVQMENIHTFAANLSQPQIQQPQPQQPQPQTQFQPPSPQHTPQPQPQTQFQSPPIQPQVQFQSPPLQPQTQFQSPPPLQPQTQFQSPPLQPQTQFQSPPIQPQVQFQSPPLQPQVQQIQQPQVQNQPPIQQPQQPQVQQIQQQQQQQPQIYQSPPQSYQQVPPNTGGAPIPTNSNILPVNPANAPNPNVEFPQPQHFS